jgi:hypothetical protein
MSIFSPWQWFCSTRTFSNSLETVLTIVALFFWPWELAGGAETTATAAGRTSDKGADIKPTFQAEIFQKPAELKRQVLTPFVC